jgi:hypothetical protein
MQLVESHSGRLGSARLHADCCEPTFTRYTQVAAAAVDRYLILITRSFGSFAKLSLIRST